MKKQKEKLGHQIKITAKDDDDTIICKHTKIAAIWLWLYLI